VGIGKSRLVTALAEERGREGWTVASGRAYAVEAGVPFALFSDAFVPLLSGLPKGSLTTLARGAEAALARLFPALSAIPLEKDEEGEAHSRTQLFWSLSRVLEGLATRGPLLVVLEDLHWSDPSSLELLHFLARQAVVNPIVFLGTINDDEREQNPTLREVEQSLASLGLVATQRLEPL
jgi:predicted ATPase